MDDMDDAVDVMRPYADYGALAGQRSPNFSPATWSSCLEKT